MDIISVAAEESLEMEAEEKDALNEKGSGEVVVSFSQFVLEGEDRWEPKNKECSNFKISDTLLVGEKDNILIADV